MTLLGYELDWRKIYKAVIYTDGIEGGDAGRGHFLGENRFKHERFEGFSNDGTVSPTEKQPPHFEGKRRFTKDSIEQGVQQGT